MTSESPTLSAVIVDYHAGPALGDCVASLEANGVRDVVVVDNAASGTSRAALARRRATVVEPGRNLGYGRGVNRGAAAAAPSRYLLVTNPDVVLHAGAVDALVAFLEARPDVAIAGPLIVRPDGSLYPSQRVFPNVWLAAAHALLAPWWPTNPATRRYRSPRPDGTVDWVSGACFVIRRDAFEAVGGFDERYFMFAEDMDLCWRVRARGLGVAAVEGAVVTHVEGVSRRGVSRAMVVAHHASALRFEAQTSRGWRRVLLPVAALVLGLRLSALTLRAGRSRGVD
ncbi:MAG: glycosyltransferase family 2 protein [Acidimicrobiales bacterium]